MKKILLILSLALIQFFIVACQDKEAMAELEAMKAQAAVEEQNEAMYRHFTAELNKQNFESGWEIFAPEFVNYDPTGVNGQLSLEETIEAFKMHFKGFPDLNIAIQEVVAKGDKIIARISVTGTHTGEWFGIPATGKKIKFSAVEIWHIKDGKCVELRVEYDRLGYMMQLGFTLNPPQSLGEKK